MAKKNKKNEKKEGRSFFWTLLFVIALGVFIFSGYQLFTIYRNYKIGVDEYEAVAEETVTRSKETPTLEDGKTDEDGTLILSAETLDYDPPEVDFETLQAQNPDVIGWLEIEAIPSISYPIVQGEDNDYYLHRTFQKTSNFAGSIFVDYANSGDFTDPNTIIYGHNMKNGSMFGQLKHLYNQELYKDSKYLWICTPNGKYRYEIFSLQQAQVNSETYTLFSGQGEEFGEYLEHMVSNSLVDFDTQNLSEDDYIVTLSTCTSNENVRFVVQARWVGTYQ